MRKLVVVLAVATMLVAPSLSRAEGEIANCTASAPSTLRCEKKFNVDSDIGIVFRLAPGTGYTGTLTATLSRLQGTQYVPIQGGSLGSYYLGAQALPLDPTMTTETTAALLPAGSYRLYVEAGAPVKACAYQCTPPEARRYTTGLGQFGAEVAPADPAV